MRKPKVCVLRSAGTNCDRETAEAFLLAGAEVQLLHINSLVEKKGKLESFHILALPGGFSYGDDVASGKILANELKFKLADELVEFIGSGKLIIGICNGFQVLVKSGLLPGSPDLKQSSSLIINDSGKFEDRWVYLKPSGRCVWTKNLNRIIYLPVAHGEGKFVIGNKQVLKELTANKQIVFKYSDQTGKLAGYPDNPNGSLEDIAGICDRTGRILGLMPHPERHVFQVQHPRNWDKKAKKYGDGLEIFKNGVDFIKKNFR
jgi:phosphoribosylformylglycinamidine synthase subunit PurQ / glutaminase